MVRALLDGRKTQTRRILKEQPGDLDKPFMMDDGTWHVTDSRGGHMSPLPVRFSKGDRLWVRETFSGDHRESGRPPREWDEHGAVWHWADGNPVEGDWTRPKPGIHMPRWASRLTLTVTDVRVQRLQWVGEDDARAEGAECTTFANVEPPKDGFPSYRSGFATLWESINGTGSWKANPWVVAVSFTVEKRNIDSAPMMPAPPEMGAVASNASA